MKSAAALLAGLLFGAGLMISGMTQPARVIGFLDLQAWDPTLMFVMGGALMVTVPTFFFSRKRGAPLLDAAFHAPLKTQLEPRLVAGSALFGMGWGLAGLCPGPAFVSLASQRLGILAFGVALMVGLLGVRAWDVRRFVKALERRPTRVDDELEAVAIAPRAEAE